MHPTIDSKYPPNRAGDAWLRSSAKLIANNSNYSTKKTAEKEVKKFASIFWGSEITRNKNGSKLDIGSTVLLHLKRYGNMNLLASGASSILSRNKFINIKEL
jgi:hypothetical protein